VLPDALVVDGLDAPVDPAEAESFLHGLVICQAAPPAAGQHQEDSGPIRVMGR
jgi:hypothetical protein